MRYFFTYILIILSFGINANEQYIDSLKNLLSQPQHDSSRVTLLLDLVELVKPGEALLFSEQAVERCNKNLAKNSSHTLFFKKHKAQAFLNLAVCYRQKDELMKADSFYTMAYDIIKDLDDEMLLANYYSNSAVLHRHLGNIDEAIKRNYSALQIYEANTLTEHQKSLLAILLNNLGVLYQQQNNTKKALEYSLKAVDQWKSLNKYDQQGLAMINAGAHYLILGNDSMAKEMYFNGLGLLKKNKGQLRSIAFAYEKIGLFYNSRREYGKALQYLNTALDVAAEANIKSMQGSIHRDISIVFFKKKSFSKALEHAQTALGMAEESAVKEDIMHIEKVLFDIYNEMEQFKKALQHFQSYVTLRDSVSNSKNNMLLERTRLNYEFDKKRHIDSLKAVSLQIKLDSEKKMRFAIIAFASMVIIIGFLAFKKRMLSIRNRQKQLEITNLRTSQFLLRTQMNPHFIFNSINSIYSIITGNEPLKAEKYLIRFSRLMRSVLNHTSKNQITLSEEINALTDYIELEQLRFDNKFSYEIKTGEDVSLHTFIPPMLIQPFIENAILHGLRHKEKNGHLLICLNVQNRVLHCTIEDNGIGRKKSGEMNARRTSHNVSRGIQITAKRIEQLRTEYNPAGVEIIDLLTDEGNPAGTRVTIQIPYLT